MQGNKVHLMAPIALRFVLTLFDNNNNNDYLFFLLHCSRCVDAG